jgi:dihydrodipicolinate synthase/N-acetylneuraminate lyase
MATPPHLLPALVSPFTRAGDVDLAAHRHNLTTLWERGIRGFVLAGSTGEGPYLESGDRRLLVEIARTTLPKRAFLLCGIATETVRQGVAFIQEAAAGGADGVLVMTPTTLTRGRPPYVESYYRLIADSSPLPVYLYSVPAVTAFELPDDLAASLAQHPNIAGIKDSGGHPVRIQRLVAGAPSDFVVFTGSTQAVTLAIAAGAHGAITASTNYMAEKLLRTVATARRSPLKARALQQEISSISAQVEAHGIPGVKAAAALAGLRPGYPRAPLQPLPASLARRWRDLL